MRNQNKITHDIVIFVEFKFSGANGSVRSSELKKAILFLVVSWCIGGKFV